MLRYAVLCLGILMSVHGHLNEKGREQIIKRFGKCLDEFNMTPEEFVKTKDIDMDPCFMACYFKEIKIMNDKGMLEVEKTNVTDHHTRDGLVRVLKEFPDLCKYVNETEVTDGDKGCERAKLITECVTEAGRRFHMARMQNRD